MPKPKKTAQGTYRIQVYVNGQRDSGTFPTSREANEWAARRKLELKSRKEGTAGKFKTFHDGFDEYFNEVCPLHKGVKWEQTRITRFKREFPDCPIMKVDDDMLRDWRDRRLKVVKGATVLRDMKLLNSVLEHCRRELKWIPANPLTDVRKPKGSRHRDYVLKGTEIRKMLRAMDYVREPTSKTQEVAAVFLLCLSTGMRSGEAVGITLDMLVPSGIALPDTKNGSARVVPLMDSAAKLVSRLVALAKREGRDSLFTVDDSSRDTLFRKARSRAGLSGFVFHDTRHTFATRVARARRVDVLSLCKIMGWSDPKQAMVYFNPTTAELASALNG